MTFYRVENKNNIGRTVNGQVSFRRLDAAVNYMQNVMIDCRKNRACQIRQVAIYSGDELIINRSV
jgi:hypothetical protein